MKRLFAILTLLVASVTWAQPHWPPPPPGVPVNDQIWLLWLAAGVIFAGLFLSRLRRADR